MRGGGKSGHVPEQVYTMPRLELVTMLQQVHAAASDGAQFQPPQKWHHLHMWRHVVKRAWTLQDRGEMAAPGLLLSSGAMLSPKSLSMQQLMCEQLKARARGVTQDAQEGMGWTRIGMS